VPLGLNDDKNGRNYDQNQKNPHFDRPPFCAAVKYTNGPQTERAGTGPLAAYGPGNPP
jgi:hypothetical protein